MGKITPIPFGGFDCMGHRQNITVEGGENMSNNEVMKLENTAFDEARESFNIILQRLFDDMEKNESNEGNITLKVSLELLRDMIPNRYGEITEVNRPLIKYKVSSAVPIKETLDGMKDTGMNLIWDASLKKYVLKHIDGEQRSLFDEDYEENLRSGI